MHTDVADGGSDLVFHDEGGGCNVVGHDCHGTSVAPALSEDDVMVLQQGLPGESGRIHALNVAYSSGRMWCTLALCIKPLPATMNTACGHDLHPGAASVMKQYLLDPWGSAVVGSLHGPLSSTHLLFRGFHKCFPATVDGSMIRAKASDGAASTRQLAACCCMLGCFSSCSWQVQISSWFCGRQAPCINLLAAMGGAAGRHSPPGPTSSIKH
jgi:hypothetical protein